MQAYISVYVLVFGFIYAVYVHINAKKKPLDRHHCHVGGLKIKKKKKKRLVILGICQNYQTVATEIS